MNTQSRALQPAKDFGVKALAALCVLSLMGLLALFVVASLEMSLGAGLADVASTWWGITTLVDLGLGILIVLGWIWLIEQRWWARLGWTLAMFGLGNFTALIFLLVRCRRASSLREVVLPPAD